MNVRCDVHGFGPNLGELRDEIGRPPVLGEHTETVLRDMLGLKPEEIATLRSEKAI